MEKKCTFARILTNGRNIKNKPQLIINQNNKL